MSNLQKEFILKKSNMAELLRDIADALEDGEAHLNLEFNDEKLIQPLGSRVPLRIHQDENGTEFGFRLNGEK